MRQMYEARFDALVYMFGDDAYDEANFEVCLNIFYYKIICFCYKIAS